MFEIFTFWVTPFSVLIPIIAGIIYYKHLLSSHKVIWYFVIFSALSNALNHFLVFFCGQTSMLQFHIYTMLEFAIISYFYSLLYKRSSVKIIYSLIAGFTIFGLINLFFLQTQAHFNTYTQTAGAIITMGYAMWYINQQSIADVDVQVKDRGISKINAGILLFNAGCLAMFISMNYVTNKEIGLVVWGIHNIILVIEYILFALGFKKGRWQKAYTSL